MRRNEGAGLGLSICAEIAAAHRWEITAQSGEQGAQFTVFFGSRAAMSVVVIPNNSAAASAALAPAFRTPLPRHRLT
jgi:hypothetical protein